MLKFSHVFAVCCCVAIASLAVSFAFGQPGNAGGGFGGMGPGGLYGQNGQQKFGDFGGAPGQNGAPAGRGANNVPNDFYRRMPGRDDSTANSFGEMGNPNGRPGQGPNMHGGDPLNRGRSKESAGPRPMPGGYGERGIPDPSKFAQPRNDMDRREEGADGMNSWARTKRGNVKVDTSFRERAEQMKQNPFMSQGKRSRHPEEMTNMGGAGFPGAGAAGGGGAAGGPGPRGKDGKPKMKKKSKVPAKPGHVKGGKASHDTTEGQNKCFKAATEFCPMRVMQENFAGYTKCVFDNRKKLPKDCEQWAGVQGACAGDMSEHCARQNPVRTTRCLKEKADKLTTACKESQYFKSLDSGYGKFRDNYKAAGGDDVFEHDPSMFGDAFKNAGGQFTEDDMEAIKKAAMESVFSSQGAGAGADQQGFGGQQNFGQQPPGGAGGGNGDASGLKRAPPGSRLTGREEKMEAIDDL